MAHDLQFAKVVNLYPCKDATGATLVTDSVAVDISGYGDAMITTNLGNYAADFTTAITISECDTSGGTYAAITGLSGAAPANASADLTIPYVAHIKNDGTRKKFIKINGTAGAGATLFSATVILYNPKLPPGALQNAGEVDIA